MWIAIGSVLLLVAGVFGLVVLINAFKESAGQGLLCMFVPLYIFYYAFARYESPKKPIVLGGWLGGMALGLALTYVGSMQAADAMAKAAGDLESGNWEVAAAPTASAEEEAPAGPRPIGELGIVATLPAGASMSDAVMGEGKMIRGNDLVVTVEKVEEAMSLEDTLEEAKDLYSGTDIETEELDNGWAMTFLNKDGENFWVKSYRNIAGKHISCSTLAIREEQQKNALAVCKSLEAE
jgi:hypothetical protein